MTTPYSEQRTDVADAQGRAKIVFTSPGTDYRRIITQLALETTSAGEFAGRVTLGEKLFAVLSSGSASVAGIAQLSGADLVLEFFGLAPGSVITVAAWGGLQSTSQPFDPLSVSTSVSVASDVEGLAADLEELTDVVAKDVTVAPIHPDLISVDTRIVETRDVVAKDATVAKDVNITPLSKEVTLIGVDLNIVETRNVVAKDATVAKDVNITPLAKEATNAKDATLIGVDTHVVETRDVVAKDATVAKDVNITPLSKEATSAKDSNVTGLRGLIGEGPSFGLRGEVAKENTLGLFRTDASKEVTLGLFRNEAAKETTLGTVAKDATVAKDSNITGMRSLIGEGPTFGLRGEVSKENTLGLFRNEAAKETTLGTVAKDSTVAKDGNITSLRGEVSRETTLGLFRSEGAKEATLNTVTKDATAAKESTLLLGSRETTLGLFRTEGAKEATLGTVAKDTTVAKEATLNTVAKDTTVAKEATLGTVAKEATIAKESTQLLGSRETTLGTVAKDATVAKDSTIAKDASLATQNALITTLNALVTQLTDLNRSGGTVVTKWAYSGGVVNANADAVVVRNDNSKRLYIVGLYASYSTAAPRGPMTLGVGVDGITYSIEAQFEMPDGAREIRFAPPLNLGGVAVDYMRLRVPGGGAGITGRCLLHCVEM